MSLPLRKLIDLAPRKPPVSAVCPFTPKDLQGLLPGLPEGAITEISGVRSSGRTTLLQASLAAATAAGELCAVVDGSDAFDPQSATAAGVRLERLLWVQCHHDVQDTLKATDLILHGGGFRLVVLDLCDLPPIELQRVPVAWWHRLRLSVENTPGVLLVASTEPVMRQAAAVQLELSGARAHWPGTLLTGVDMQVRLRKPVQSALGAAVLRARAI
jgi:hypothetical protein